METFRKDDVQENHQNYRFLHKSRSDSVSIPVNSIELNSSGRSLLYRGSAGTSSQRATCDVIQRQERGDATNYNNQVRVNNEVKNKHLLKSGEMGMCRVPYCMICPTLCYYKTPLTASSASQGLYHNNDGVQHGGAKAKIRKKLLLLKHFTFGIINPHAKAFQQWMLFFVISLFVSFIIDPFFYHLLSVKKDSRCIKIDWPMTITLVVLRSIADLIYLTNMLVQFRLAFIPFKSRYVGAPELIDHPRKIALHYLFGPFFLDLFIVLPIPQIISLIFLPKAIASSGANYTNNLLRVVVLIQYVPRLHRCMDFAPQVYESQIIPRIFFRNLLTLLIASHVAGSVWYLLGLQRLNQCLVDACHSWGITNCMRFMDCGNENDFHAFEGVYRWNDWKQNENSSVCFTEDGFPYGVYVKVINLTAQDSRITRYMYSFFWGFQQLSTLAGNLTPSYSVWEVLFSICITGSGLFFFPFFSEICRPSFKVSFAGSWKGTLKNLNLSRG